MVTSETAAEITKAKAAARRRGLFATPDLDFVKDDPNAPAWVKNWSGPFTITEEEE